MASEPVINEQLSELEKLKLENATLKLTNATLAQQNAALQKELAVYQRELVARDIMTSHGIEPEAMPNWQFDLPTGMLVMVGPPVEGLDGAQLNGASEVSTVPTETS